MNNTTSSSSDQRPAKPELSESPKTPEVSSGGAGLGEASAPKKVPDDPEDAGLVERTVVGDATAFERLFVKYRQRLFGVAWRLVHDEDAALDVVQDAFVKAYERLAELRGEARFYPWIRRITVNLSIDRLRHMKRGAELEFDEAQYGRGAEARAHVGSAQREREAREAPAHKAEMQEFSKDLQGALNQISEAHRTVFLLHAAEGMSYREIADALGVNIGTVMSRLFYARKRLQELLSPHLDLGASE